MDEKEPNALEPGQASETIRRLLGVVLETSLLKLTYELQVADADLQVTSAPDRPVIRVNFEGPDTGFLIARNGEMLHALEALAVDILRLSPEDHELVSFDAEGYKAARAERMRRAAAVGVQAVQATGRPYSFPPMNSRERRMLHLELASSGLRTASSGEVSRRFVVLYPAEPAARAPGETNGSREKIIRNAFRPR